MNKGHLNQLPFIIHVEPLLKLFEVVRDCILLHDQEVQSMFFSVVIMLLRISLSEIQ